MVDRRDRVVEGGKVEEVVVVVGGSRRRRRRARRRREGGGADMTTAGGGGLRLAWSNLRDWAEIWGRKATSRRLQNHAGCFPSLNTQGVLGVFVHGQRR